MDRTVPAPAAVLLNFIGDTESGKSSYEAVYGHKQHLLPKPLTKMTLGEVLASGPIWAQTFGSSACGRYQFMAGRNHTLQGLKNELGLLDRQIFDANLQDRLGYHLLLRRGYDNWIKGEMSDSQFMLNLSKEWASLPVPQRVQGQKRVVERGQSYYAGDGLNKALITSAKVEAVLKAAKAAKSAAQTEESTVQQLLPQILANPRLMGMIMEAIQRSTQKVADNPAVPELRQADAPIVADQIFGELQRDAGFQHVTNTEKWWQKRSRWSMIFAIGTPILAMTTGLAIPEEMQEFAITGIIGVGNLIAGWLAYRAGTAKTPLFAG